MSSKTIKVKRLPSGYYHVRLYPGGPCEWAQPPLWPCDEDTLRWHAHPEASDGFLRLATKAARDKMDALAQDANRWH